MDFAYVELQSGLKGGALAEGGGGLPPFHGSGDRFRRPPQAYRTRTTDMLTDAAIFGEEERYKKRDCNLPTNKPGALLIVGSLRTER